MANQVKLTRPEWPKRPKGRPLQLLGELMKYMGSKRRFAKTLLPIILADRGDRVYVEPFIGGGNMMNHVPQGAGRIGSDYFGVVIKALTLIRDNPESLPETNAGYTEADHNIARRKPPEDLTPAECVLAFGASFGGKFGGVYARSHKNPRDYVKDSRTSAIKQSPHLQGVQLYHCSYDELAIPPNSIIYCDPPYQGTTRYKGAGSFDHDAFWEWCRAKVREGHRVFVSEYTAPEDFECVHEISTVCSMDANNVVKATERLFTYKV